MVILITGLSNTAIRRLNARYACPTPKLTAYVCPPNFQTEMYAGHVACCPLVSHGGYADETDRWTDGRTPDRYIMLSARRGQRNNVNSQLTEVQL